MLSDSQIRALKISDGKRHADRDGLVLEIRQNKKKVVKKVFLFRFQWDKKPQTITIGNYPSISLLKARETASQYRDLINNGVDPRAKPDNLVPLRITFGEVAHQWFRKNQKTWKEFARNRHFKSISRDISPIIGDKPIDDVTTADLISILKPHEDAEHHDVSHRLCARLQVIFEYAVASSLTKNYPFIGLKGTLTPKPDVKHQPAIDSDEAHAMLEVLKHSNASMVSKLYIELLAHLFVRPSELRLAKWSEFNLKTPNAEWTIPTDRTKMKREHWVPLSPHVISLLKELRLLTGFTPYLFTSPHLKTQQPISEASIRKLLHKAGYKDRHTAHGFRSLASSVLHEQGNFKIDAIEAQLAHKVQGVRGVYMRASFKAERRELMHWYSEWLLKDQLTYKMQVDGGI